MACIKDSPSNRGQSSQLQATSVEHVKKLVFHGDSKAALHANMTMAEADLAYWKYATFYIHCVVDLSSFYNVRAFNF